METLGSLLKAHPRMLVRHHIDSYNTFIASGMRDVVKEKGRVTKMDAHCRIDTYVGGEDFSAIRLEFASSNEVLPVDQRMKNHTYSRNIVADVLFVLTDAATGSVERHVEEGVRIGIIPIMLGSSICMLDGKSQTDMRGMGECPYDLGGYFIINGKEKVIVSQERGVLNRLFIERNTDTTKFSHSAFVRCVSTTKSTKPRTLYVRVVSSEAAKGARTNAIVVEVPGLKWPDSKKGNKSLPLFWLFRALGVESDAEILGMISEGDAAELEFLRASVVDGNMVYTQRQALDFLASHVPYGSEDSAVVTLTEDFLPQVASLREKAVLLGYYCRRVVRTCMGRYEPSDRDSFLNKRISTSGFLITDLFRKYYEQFWINHEIAVDNEYNIVHKTNYVFPLLERFVTPQNHGKLFPAEHIQNGMTKSFKGQWGTLESMSTPPDLGVVQDVSRVSYMSFVSHLRRVAMPLDDKAKVTGPHKLSSTQWGIMCPCESPDGRNVGLLKNLALLAWVTEGGMLFADVVTAIERSFPEDFGRAFSLSGKKVFVNSVPCGSFRDGTSLRDAYVALESIRDRGEFGAHASLSYNPADEELHVRTDDGRVTRPLFDLGNDDKIVYVDVEESNTSTLIAMTRADVVPGRHTHLEIHPCAMFSVYSATIPFADHNQAARNAFSSAQGKQAIGVSATNFNERIDTAAYFLHYPQRPIAETAIAAMLPAAGVLNNGENLIVAVACYSGYNMEDAVILNSASVNRGMFNVSIFKTIFGQEETQEVKDAYDDSLTRTSVVVSKPMGPEYEKLDETGLPRPNAYLGVDDVAIGRTRYVDSWGARTFGDFGNSAAEAGGESTHEQVDASVTAGQNNHGFVDRVYAIHDPVNESSFCKVRVRKSRSPELGDKVASRHGQKGVVGSLMAPQDMPVTADGLVPDMIVNPHAFPSRMTVGHLIECVSAKAAVLLGSGHVDATPFSDFDAESYGDALVDGGFQRHGNELMYNGMTGEQMRTDIFVGPTFYYRLKHMVDDKINYRATGRMVGLTGQPTKGRANDGGMRIGEMERDGIIAHGMSTFMKESFGERSDGTRFVVDDHGFSFANEKRMLVGRKSASKLGDHARLHGIECPAALKLLSHELKAFHIDLKLEVPPPKPPARGPRPLDPPQV